MVRTRTAVLAAALAAVSLAAFAQIHTVTRVTLVAKPRVYNGSCPATIDFIGTIHLSRHPARVEYEWERSDGARGRREVIEIRAAGQGVRESWTLGRPGEHTTIGMRLHVLAPTGISSPEVRVRVNCRR
ncbi:MAG TPA: hypothetical protein VFO24_08980 [Usitatibacter sp.]|nr:hypothetical protein [Usitatibacter sp.]